MSKLENNTTSLQTILETINNLLTDKDYLDSKITYGTTDLTAGTSELTTGTIYVVYE